jgi:hypothetical protein
MESISERGIRLSLLLGRARFQDSSLIQWAAMTASSQLSDGTVDFYCVAADQTGETYKGIPHHGIDF